MYHEKINELVRKRKVLITDHAWDAMDERGINTKNVIDVITRGKIIEEYLDDEPCPSFLIFGWVNKRPMHVLVALCKDHIRIVTTYEPSLEKWEDFTKRK